MNCGTLSVSVVIPTFNRSHTLGRAIHSAANQTCRPLEIIVVDDGSDDDTQTLIEARFPFCRYLHQEHRGVSSARNRGIQAARGAWIALLDSDDEWLEDKLRTQLQLLESKPGYRICHTEEIWIRNGRRVNQMKKHRKRGGRIFRHCLPRCVISPSSVLMQKSLLKEAGLFDEALPACEDYDLWLSVCAEHPVAFVETPQIIKYGGHPDQLSRRIWGLDRYRIRALEKIMASGRISGGDLLAAAKVLEEKARIVAAGAEKRGKLEESRYYAAVAMRAGKLTGFPENQGLGPHPA